ncbi:DMT family transporter [Rhodobacteraceae bacterium]|nr:DMT family transporter [Paracoccaceae bacterium]
MTNTQIPARAWVDLTLLALLWGGSFLAIRTALDEIGFLSSVAHRVLWATIVLWAIVWFKKLPVPKSPKVWGAFLVMGCLNNVIPFSLMAWGQLSIEVGLTAILNAATAIWGVLIAAMVFSSERLSVSRALGVTIGFIGVAIAIGLQNFTGFDIRSLAQLAVIAGTLSYACAGSWARANLSEHPPLVAAAGMLTGSTVVMLPLAWAVEGPLPMALSATTWAAITYYALASTALAYILYYRILAATGAGNLLLVTLMIPPIAILLGAWVRGETLSPNAYLGFAILAVGLLLMDGRLGHVLRKIATR